MGNVVILDENTINKIAAGEVVDRPASIVKELVENSIDAKAKNITIEIKKGGIKQIIITDDGTGISSDDVLLAFERHATSKIRKEEDIQSILSMGFRGEALASIASIAKVTMKTRRLGESIGSELSVNAGKRSLLKEIPFNIGTTINVEDIFYNVPARYKFLRKDFTEAGYIEDIVTLLALAHPEISFKYINSGKLIFSTSGGTDLKSTIFNIFGKEVLENTLDVNYEYQKIKIEGVVGNPKISRSTRKNEMLFVNSRYVKNKTMTKALERAFEQNLNIGKFPFAILNIYVLPETIDVNVHPAKLEVKFEDENKVFEAVYHAVKNAIENFRRNTSPFAAVEDANKNDKENKNEKIKYLENVNNVEYLKPKEGPVYYNEKSNVEIKDILNVYENVLKEDYKTKIDYKYIGSFLNTYILIEIAEKLYIIDQHAAHERLLYEKIKEGYYSKNRETQMLILPTLVEFKHSEKELIEKNMEMFTLAGFVLEDFGDNAIKISGVPNTGYEINYQELFLDILDGLEGNTKTTAKEKEERFIETIACKAAVKANMKLTKEEHIVLINEMISLKDPFTCPHGRPTAYEISKYEIERRFSRK